MHIKFRGLNFCVLKKIVGINFCGYGSMEGTIVVEFAKYASYCGLIFVDKRHTIKSMKIYKSKNFHTYGKHIKPLGYS